MSSEQDKRCKLFIRCGTDNSRSFEYEAGEAASVSLWRIRWYHAETSLVSSVEDAEDVFLYFLGSLSNGVDDLENFTSEM